MVKKIAAPRKAAAKTPARKATKAKAVTAPKTHKPKGSPKERLAYLNKGEMKALEMRKGSPARRGPKGLPSFAEDSASSKGVSRGDTSGTKGSGSTQTSTGSVSNASPGSRGAGSNYGAGSGRPGSSPSTGGGSKGGYNSGISGSRFGGASTQRPGMGGNAGKVPTGYQGPAGTIGTPRGYVNAAQAAAVDRAMAPVAAIGQQLPYFTPGIGPIVGRVASAIPTIARAAAPYVSKALGAAETALSASEVAKINQGLAAYQKAAAAAGRKPGEMAVSMRAIPVSAEQRAAWEKGPSLAEKGYNAVQRGIDRVTSTMGVGVGETARAKAASMAGVGAGIAQTGIEAGRKIGESIRDYRNSPSGKTDRERSTNSVAGGKTNKGGYSRGGPVRRTFKNK